MTGLETAWCVVVILALKSISKTGQVAAECGVEPNVVGEEEQRAIDVVISMTMGVAKTGKSRRYSLISLVKTGNLNGPSRCIGVCNSTCR